MKPQAPPKPTKKAKKDKEEIVRDKTYWVRFLTLLYLKGRHRGLHTILRVQQESNEEKLTVIEWNKEALDNVKLFQPDLSEMKIKVAGLLDHAAEVAMKRNSFDLPSAKAQALTRVAQTHMQLHGLDAKTQLEKKKLEDEMSKLERDTEQKKGNIYLPVEDEEEYDPSAD